MGVINIPSMYGVMKSIMEGTYKGSPEERFSYAKARFLNEVDQAIEENKDLLIKEVSDAEGYDE
jgi:hypothetical protein